FRACGTGVDGGCSDNPGGQRYGPVASGAGTHRRTVAAKARAEGGRRGLHPRRGYRGDGRRKGGFSGEPAARRRGHGKERSPAAATQRFPFSAGGESLVVSRGQVLAPRRMPSRRGAGWFPAAMWRRRRIV